MPTPITIRPYKPDDKEWALRLNNDAVPAVNSHTNESWDALIGMASAVRIAETAEGPAGLLVMFVAGAAYESPNYRWFSNTYPDFLYVDRIVVEPLAQGAGIGRALYDDGIALCQEIGAPVFTCEVNELPPNPGSLAFHARFGFEIVGRQDTDNGRKRVALMARPASLP